MSNDEKTEETWSEELSKGIDDLSEAFSHFGVAASMAIKEFANTMMQIADAFANAELYATYFYRTKPNNWLKLHGYPMRRKKVRRR